MDTPLTKNKDSFRQTQIFNPTNPFSFYYPGCSQNLLRKQKCICPICFEILNDHIAYLNICYHSFCSTCIEIWKTKSNKCPLCRRKFSSIKYI